MTVLRHRDTSALRRMAVFAFGHSPYYADLYARAGVEPFTAALPEALPMALPEDLARRPQDFRSTATPYKVVGSSGTSGQPKLLYRTEDDVETSVRNQMAIMEWCGVGEGDVVGIPQPFGFWGYGELTQEAARRLGGLAVPVGTLSDETALSIMEGQKVTVLDVSPSRLRRMLDHQPDVAPAFSPRVVMVSGEPVSSSLRERVMTQWGAALFEQYGSEETDALGGAATVGGPVRLLNDSFVFEVLDDDGHSIPVGQAGELVVTSLYHMGTPLVRYRIGDRVLRSSETDITILGRCDERVILHDSVKLFPFQIDSALAEAGINCEQWQCQLSGGTNTTHLRLVIAVPEREAALEIESRVRDALLHATIDVEQLACGGVISCDVDLDAASFETSPRGKTRRFVDRRVWEGEA